MIPECKSGYSEGDVRLAAWARSWAGHARQTAHEKAQGEDSLRISTVSVSTGLGSNIEKPCIISISTRNQWGLTTVFLKNVTIDGWSLGLMNWNTLSIVFSRMQHLAATPRSMVQRLSPLQKR